MHACYNIHSAYTPFNGQFEAAFELNPPAGPPLTADVVDDERLAREIAEENFTCKPCEDLEDELPGGSMSYGDDVPKYSAQWDRLKNEAFSLKHLLTHLPKNPFCKTCQRAKPQRKQHRRRTKTLGPVPQNFGDQGTADHF